MKGVRSFEERLKKELKNPEFQKAFEEEEIYASLAIQMAKIMEARGLTQKKLAQLLHTSQQAVSRLENPSNRSCSLNTLIKLAKAFHKKIKIQFI